MNLIEETTGDREDFVVKILVMVTPSQTFFGRSVGGNDFSALCFLVLCVFFMANFVCTPLEYICVLVCFRVGVCY